MKLRRSMLPPTRFVYIPPHALRLDRFSRVSSVPFKVVFPPRADNTCRCGCLEPLTGHRRSWAHDWCQEAAVYAYWLWKAVPSVIRWALWRRDKGVCFRCKVQVPGGRKGPWDGHHITAVEDGGGRMGLSNLVTVCQDCHGILHHGHAPSKVRQKRQLSYRQLQRKQRKSRRQR